MNSPAFPACFLSCDWGTSHFRLRLVEEGTLRAVDEIESGEGAGRLRAQCAPGGRALLFEEVLVGHARELFSRSGRNAGVCVVSGMASSNLGWIELPYARVPLALRAEHFPTRRLAVEVPGHGDLQVVMVGGARTERDVMRGEETEILGLAALLPEIRESACLVLPGTHSKHIWIEKGALVRFSTYMTGELYAHLRGMPTLAGASGEEAEALGEAFLAGVDEARASGLSAALFQIRARSILSEARDGAAFLSGLLIGAELGDLAATGADVFLGGSPRLGRLYAGAAARLGLAARALPAEVTRQALLRGHALLLERLFSFSS